MTRCEAWLMPGGMIRCDIRADKVVGFLHRFIKALITPPEGPHSAASRPGRRIMHDATAEQFQALRAKMESRLTPRMLEVLGLDAASPPFRQHCRRRAARMRRGPARPRSKGAARRQVRVQTVRVNRDPTG